MFDEMWNGQKRKCVYGTNGIQKKSKISRVDPIRISIAIPSSCLQKACSHIMKTNVASQIARSAAMFFVQEILIYGIGDDAVLLKTLLEYTECPQYLRKYLFGKNELLRNAGVLAPLATPHHMKTDSEWKYREGICVRCGKEGSWIDIGLAKPVKIGQRIKTNVRVTVKRKSYAEYALVSPEIPFTKNGLYWGYNVRSFGTLNEILDQKSEREKYDLIIGTSQYGSPVHDLSNFENFERLLLVFGGPEGLEHLGFTKDSFNEYVNVFPFGQGTRTIRTEEAVPLVLQSINSLVSRPPAYPI